VTDRTCYLILATPRSGSTLLGQGLQASGLAGDPKEFFGPKMPFWMERWGTPALESYVARLVPARSTPNGVFGAKLLYQQLIHLESAARQDPHLSDLPLASILAHLFPNLHLIWVSRKDKVRQAISWFKARQTGVWGQDTRREGPKLGRAWRIGDEPLLPGELAFDYEGIADLFRQAETEDAAIKRFCAESGQGVYRVLYEDFAPRYEETVADILRWMNIAPGNISLPRPRTVKLADDRTDEWVERFQELHAANAKA
jgi:LPS sulfotransferase NodH